MLTLTTALLFAISSQPHSQKVQTKMKISYAPNQANLSAELQTAICKPIEGIERAWNTHDMDAYASFLTEDCRWVNVVGMFWNGKPSVVKAHAAFHATMFKDVSYVNEEANLSIIAPNVATAIVTIKMGAYKTPDGHAVPPRQTRLTIVVVERAGRWLIASAQNTPIDAEAAKFDPGQ